MKETCDTNFGKIVSHAYCIEATRESLPFLENYLHELLGEKAQLLTQTFALFGVDDGRALSGHAYSRTSDESPYVHIVYADSFSVESQNALLKAIEEPSLHIHYVFVTPRLDKLLPTLLSRSVSFSLISSEITKKYDLEIKEFLAGGRVSRMAIVARYLKELEDEEGEASRRALDSFFEKIISHVSKISTHDSAHVVEVVSKARKYIRDKGSSQKMIAEYVALMIPEHFT